MGSKFVLKISLPPNFPDSAPKCLFMKPYPFHPNVEQGGGSLCYRLFGEWTTKYYKLSIPGCKLKQFFFELIFQIVVTNIAGFLANPNFPGG